MYRTVSMLALAALFAVNAAAAAPASSGSISTTAPETHDKKSFSLGIEPLYLLLGGIGGIAEAHLTDRSRLGLGGLYIPSHKNGDSYPNDYSWSTYEVYLGPTFMLTGDNSHNGFYLSPAIGYTGTTISDYSVFKLSGSLDTFEGRITTGYQFVGTHGMKFVGGLGLRILDTGDVKIKDSAGRELYRVKSDQLSGLALDLRLAFMF